MRQDEHQIPDPAGRPAPHALTAHVEAALGTATDGQLRRVVGMLDSLLIRGDADRLLAGVRPRIGALQLSRPLRFGRLLALPLEGALVNTADWHPDAGGIPRAALAPLIEAVRRALGTEAEVIEMGACGHTTREPAVVAGFGRRLWQAAAGAKLPAALPGWDATGLPQDAAPSIVALSRTLWHQATA